MASELHEPAPIVVIGAPRTPLADVYQQLLRAPWWVDLLIVAGVFDRVVPTLPTPTFPYPRNP